MKSEPWYINPKIYPALKTAIIIGGGLAGTSVAYSLALRGWSIKLIERSKSLAAEASGNPFGILSPLITHKNDPIGEFYLRGFEYSLSHLQELLKSDQQVNFNNSGLIELSASKINKNLSDIIIPNGDIKILSSDEATSLARLKINNHALYIEKGGFLNPGLLCRANVKAGGKNIEVLFSKEILSLVNNKGFWRVFDIDGAEIASAPVVIIANAADVVSFSQCSWIPIHKVRGQLTYLPAKFFCLKKTICYDGGYITPEINGVNYVGATYSRNNLSYDISLEDHITNIKNLRNVLDVGDADNSSLQGRVSFRAGVIDRRPVIGAVPDIKAFYDDYSDLKHGRKFKDYPAGKYIDGLYVSTGYGSRGLTACPIGGELIAAMINNEELPLPQNILNMLNPARFIIKRLKVGI